MQLILRYSNGRRVDALLLWWSAGWLRISTRGHKDARDLRLVRGSWVDEDGRRLSIEAMLALPRTREAARAAGVC